MLGAVLLCGCGALAGIACGLSLGRRRQRRSLNEALHELRRPLQALALAGGGEAREWLPQAGAALAELDRRINLRRGIRAHRRVGSVELLRSADRRWRPIAAVQIEIPGEDAALEIDPVAVGSALDNLIANAVEHGDGPVRVSPALDGSTIALQVLNDGAQVAAPRCAAELDPRRGHGLRIAERIAREQAGSLLCGETDDGVVCAALQLPLAARR